jgi:hypothetical protein
MRFELVSRRAWSTDPLLRSSSPEGYAFSSRSRTESSLSFRSPCLSSTASSRIDSEDPPSQKQGGIPGQGGIVGTFLQTLFGFAAAFLLVGFGFYLGHVGQLATLCHGSR